MTPTNHEALLAENDSLRGDVQDLEDKVARLELVIENARDEMCSVPFAIDANGVLAMDTKMGWCRDCPGFDRCGNCRRVFAKTLCPALFEKVKS